MPGQADAICGLSSSVLNPEFLSPMNVPHREEAKVEGWEGAYTNVWDYVS